jgi:hypothetical protein
MAKNQKEKLREFNHVDLLFPSKYAKAGDLRGKKVTVVIESIEPREELTMQGGRKDFKPVIYLVDKDKGIILNKTNARAIAKVYGPEVMSWIGKAIVIHSARVEARGEMVDAIRVDVDATRAKAGIAADEPEHDAETGEVEGSYDFGPPPQSEEEQQHAEPEEEERGQKRAPAPAAYRARARR